MSNLTETRFTTFWRGLNAAMRAAGRPDYTFGEAKALWLAERDRQMRDNLVILADRLPVRGTAGLSLIERAARATGEIA